VVVLPDRVRPLQAPAVAAAAAVTAAPAAATARLSMLERR
jgi:hypothetical protein